jgi:hypothetical protein
MRIPLLCHECLRSQASGFVYANATVDENGALVAECDNGHSNQWLTRKPNHEWLATAGALALCDRYLREAVFSFAAALESSFAFYVEASLQHAGLGVDSVRELVRKNRLAERRIGMVSVCYLRDTGRQFPHLQGKWVEFRNDVVHNGHWPSPDKAVDYAGHVCAAIVDLQKTLGNALDAYYDYRLGTTLLASPGQKFPMDDTESFLDFYAKAESIHAGLAEFNKRGPHRVAGRPRLIK